MSADINTEQMKQCDLLRVTVDAHVAVCELIEMREWHGIPISNKLRNLEEFLLHCVLKSQKKLEECNGSA